MQDQLERDLKAALLAGDKQKAEVLKGVKNAILYEAVAKKLPRDQIGDELILAVLARESKKRQEAADIYKQGGSDERAEAELAEKAILDSYLPEQASEEDIKQAVGEEVAKLSSPSSSDMGTVIGAVRAKFGATADGATIARLTKQALEKST